MFSLFFIIIVLYTFSIFVLETILTESTVLIVSEAALDAVLLEAKTAFTFVVGLLVLFWADTLTIFQFHVTVITFFTTLTVLRALIAAGNVTDRIASSGGPNAVSSRAKALTILQDIAFFAHFTFTITTFFTERHLTRMALTIVIHHLIIICTHTFSINQGCVISGLDAYPVLVVGAARNFGVTHSIFFHFILGTFTNSILQDETLFAAITFLRISSYTC